jgi:hypothetical protein
LIASTAGSPSKVEKEKDLGRKRERGRQQGKMEMEKQRTLRTWVII